MNNRSLALLKLTVTKPLLDDIEHKALSMVQERANHLYTSRDYTVAMAWVEAVLEHLYQAGVINAEGSLND